jgi:hypothetical protein
MGPLQNTNNSYSADAIPAPAIRRTIFLQPGIVELEKSLVQEKRGYLEKNERFLVEVCRV